MTMKTLVVSYIFYSPGMTVFLAAGLLLSLFSGRLPFAYGTTAASISAGALLFLGLCALLLRRPEWLSKALRGSVGAARRLGMIRDVDEGETDRLVREACAISCCTWFAAGKGPEARAARILEDAGGGP